MAPRPLVLLSNDDGHSSRGIRALREALLPHAEVVIAAPETEQSATSHSLSLHHPLRLREVEAGTFAIDGTPVDCVYIALHAGARLLARRPDLVVSGVNHGLNLGQDVFYSGTVAAAREGALRGIPALAVSAHTAVDVREVAELGARVALELLRSGAHPVAPLINLNVPKGWNGQVRGAHLGSRIYEEAVDFRKDPRGREYMWLGGPGVRHEANPGSDTDAYDQGVASITPLMLDLTSPAGANLAASLATKTSRRDA